MAWFKVDDQLYGHPKWLATPPRARALWVTAGSWCADKGTDGVVPEYALVMLGGTKADARALVKSGLWRYADGGYLFHDWIEFQPDAASVKAQRDNRADAGMLGAHNRWHKGRGVSVFSCEFCFEEIDENGEIARFDDSKAIANPIANAWQDDSKPYGKSMPRTRTPIKGKEIREVEVTNAQAIAPTPEIDFEIQEPWRCSKHQGIDVPCHACADAKRAHKAQEAQREVEAKRGRRKAESEEFERQSAERERKRVEAAANPEVIETAKAAAFEAVRRASLATKGGKC